MRSETKLSILMVSSVTYLVLPVAYWLLLTSLLAEGAFPVNADTIGLPLAGSVVLWLIGLIIAAAIAFAVVAKNLGK